MPRVLWHILQKQKNPAPDQGDCQYQQESDLRHQGTAKPKQLLISSALLDRVSSAPLQAPANEWDRS